LNSRTGHFEPIAREGLIILMIPAFLSFMAWWFGFFVLSLFFLIVAVAVGFFFRNPERVSNSDEASLLSPADGVVMEITENATGPCLVQTSLTRISVFMSVFNVHVNRWPFSGVVENMAHRTGKFLDARDPSSSILNENNSIVVKTDYGPIEIVQIAGKIARRIVWWVRVGDPAIKGARFGLIKFGSRVDVYLPKTFLVCTTVGSKVRSGITVIAQLKSATDQ
jgi:phosphatidylserine decarboxylase